MEPIGGDDGLSSAASCFLCTQISAPRPVETLNRLNDLLATAHSIRRMSSEKIMCQRWQWRWLL